MNILSEKRLAGGHPIVRVLARKHAEWCEQKTHDFLKSSTIKIEIAQCHRDPKYQDDLFSLGRNERGEIVDQKKVVTHVKGSDSYHSCLPFGCSLAWDIFPDDPSTKNKLEYDKVPEALWRAFANYAQTLALTAGFFWTGKKHDPGHFNIGLLGFSASAIHKKFTGHTVDDIRAHIWALWQQQNPSVANLFYEQIEKEMGRDKLLV